MADDDEAGRGRIFISHTSSDQRIATALQVAIERLCPSKICVYHSSRQDNVGGVGVGADWFEWIGRQVRDADITLVVLTKASLAKPWLHWETGAVYGAAAAAADQKAPGRLWPLLYGLNAESLPGPLAAMNAQARRGDDEAQFRQVVEQILDWLADRRKLTARDQRSAAGQVDAAVQSYLSGVHDALLTSPIVPTEAAVQEWCARLDELLLSGRHSEVNHLRDWLDIAFGRDDGDRLRPLDARIHRRLGQLYVAAQDYRSAAEQFRLTYELAPRDIYVLRTLGEAALKAGSEDEAQQCLEEIERLDVSAFARNADCAALKGKWLRRKGRVGEAQRLYDEASRNVSDSYYLLDLLAQVQVERDDLEGARSTYARALALLERKGERSMWACATGAAAALALGREGPLGDYLQGFAAARPTADNVAVLERTLGSVNACLPPAERFEATALRVPSVTAEALRVERAL